MNRMHFMVVSLHLIAALLTVTAARAQKAWPGDLNPLVAKIPIPGSSSTCYATAAKTTDPGSGTVNIKGNGESFKAIEAELTSIATGGMAGAAVAQSTITPQYAQQPQQPSSGVSSTSDVALMKLIGQAQMAASQINQLCSELSQKRAKLSKAAVQAVKMKNCPEVRQGSYVGPTCACTQANDVEYYTARVAAMDDYISQVVALINEYLPKIKTQVSIVDDMEAKAKYGDAVANPGFKQMAVNIQRQSLAGITTLLALSGDAWNDGAVEYANEANARSGAMTHCK